MVLTTKSLKAIAGVTIFALTILSSLLPYKIRSSKRILSVLNVLAGGVFLGAGLCHLLADSAELFEEYAEEGHDHDHDHDHDDHDHDVDPAQLTHGGGEDEPFPWAFCCAGIGFISTLAMEQFAHWLTHSPKEEAPHTEEDHLLEHGAPSSDNYRTLAQPESINNSAKDVEHGHSHNHNHHDHHHHNHHDHHHDDHHGHSHVPLNTDNQSFIIFITLWVALSYHSIVEGIVLGSADQETIKSILVAILAHKGLESFSLGTGLIRSGASKLKFFLFCLAFACMTPIGIILGLFVSNLSGPVVAAVTGFGAGTFCYVSIVEILLPEFNKQQDVLFKIICLAAGFGGMSALALWV